MTIQIEYRSLKDSILIINISKNNCQSKLSSRCIFIRMNNENREKKEKEEKNVNNEKPDMM